MARDQSLALRSAPDDESMMPRKAPSGTRIGQKSLENGMRKLLACLRPVPGGARALAGAGRACRWMSPRAMPSRCPSPFPIYLAGDPTQAQAGANIAQRGARRSRTLRPVQADRSQGLCRAHHQHQCGAQFRQLAGDQCARPGGRPGRAAARRPAESRFPALGCLWREPDAGPAILHPAGELAPHRPYGLGRDL